MIRVLLADDQAVVRGGLRMILEAHDDIDVIGEASDGAQALELARRLNPDVLLVNIQMPVMDGIEATRRLVLSGATTRVLVLTTYGVEENVYEALRAGAAGFLVKTDSPERLVDGVRVVATGQALLGPETTRRLINRFIEGKTPNAPLPPELDELTARELEVLKLATRGLSNAEIAAALYVSDGTRQDPHGPCALEARATRPGAGGRLRIRVRACAARRGQSLTGAQGRTAPSTRALQESPTPISPYS